MSDLLTALGAGRGDVVAMVGAGGKTTLIYRLAAVARERGLRVVVTTTTHMGLLPESITGPVFVEAEGSADALLDEGLRREGRATLLGRRIRSDKLEGIAPSRVDELAHRADLVLVEADGARGRSLKLPAAHEPVVPSSTTLLVVVAALDVLGAPLDDTRVHRLEIVSDAIGRATGTLVREGDLVAVLRHPAGYLSRAGGRTRPAVFLNKAEGPEAAAAAERIARDLIPPYALVAAGSARRGEARSWT